MSKDESVFHTIGRRLNEAQKILVLSHIRPDGDAVGALLGLGLSLSEAGKTVQMVLSDGVPGQFRYLPDSDLVCKKAEGPFDLTVVLDCSDLKRAGSALNDGLLPPDVNIDHHVTNLNFGRLNYIQPQAVATSQILAESLEAWGLAITPPVASAVLSGIVSDSLGFRTSNMTPGALRTAADLMEKGADLTELYNRALVRRPFNATRYWGAGLARLEKQDRMVWASLTLEDRRAAGYPGKDDADLINVISAIDDFDVCLMFVEQKGGRVKVSWRSVPGFDVSQVALKFGGGGHPAAAGAEIDGTMQVIMPEVLKATREMLFLGY